MYNDLKVTFHLLHIPSEIEFNRSSIQALFQCMKIICPYQGYDISNKENKYTKISKCTKGICNQDCQTSTILRCNDCNHFTHLKAVSSICEKCQKIFRNKNYNNNCKSKISNKENENTGSTEDIIDKIKAIAPNLKQNQITLIHFQIVASNSSKQGLRWDKNVICIALSLYNRKPAAYRDLTQNNWLPLPSESLLQRYKNAVHQRSGIFHDMMSWMSSEAKSQCLPMSG